MFAGACAGSVFGWFGGRLLGARLDEGTFTVVS
jgi:hypothetical protein